MIRKLMKTVLCAFFTCMLSPAFAQTQSCPININFATGSLTHWFAYTGNNKYGNGQTAIKATYDSLVAAPTGTINAKTIYEYNLPTVPGIQVKTAATTDIFGGFSTVPVINGYVYGYSILLGSTSVTRNTSQNGPSPGGYIRGVSYKISVPPGPISEPYTMTYAYAMVLENGSHNSNDQPLFSATLKTNDSVITCASPSYYLPTFNNATPEGGKATLDTATAKANGFKLSPTVSPNPNPNSNQQNASHLQDVWTKGWTEVTFDLSPYRGQQVSLTFEADNCVPGGHFAYAYVALRNTCAGLLISGDSSACSNTSLTYSIPALAGATYQWSVPSDWTITGGSTGNIISVNVGSQSGVVIAREQNSCANLSDTLPVVTTPPTIPGSASGDATACAGTNSNILTVSGNRGNVLTWIGSTDGGTSWTNLSAPGNSYTAQNLTATTLYKAVVQNGKACDIDSSTGATITVDQKSVGGVLSPANTSICKNQDVAIGLVLLNRLGQVLNWQSSLDSSNWLGFTPQYTDSSYGVSGLNISTLYRVIVKNGVCPADTSSVSKINYLDVAFPQAAISPTDTTICSGGTASLNATINIGTNYTWSNAGSLSNQGNGTVGFAPFIINAQAKPATTTDYVISVQNDGCPNLLTDTFHIDVIAPIIVNAGNDTSVVIGQPLQLLATSNDTTEDSYSWTPSTGLNNNMVPDPLAILTGNPEYITYTVKATDAYGCYGVDDVVVRVFKTAPDIFVPNAFTPGKAGNNIFRPIGVGVASLQYFRVFNRWGQLVYSSSRFGDGCDGTLGGKPQDTGSFVWMVQGTDYTGKIIAKKGTMTLIR